MLKKIRLSLFVFLILSIIVFHTIGIILSLYSVLFYLIILLSTRNKYVYYTLSTLILVEIFLYFYSPYKSYGERNGKIYYTSAFRNCKNNIENIHNPFSSSKKYTVEYSFIHKYNNYGFRDEIFTKKKYDFFIIGDSFVEGIGTDAQSTIDKNIEKEISCNNCILNLGISGNDVVNELKILKTVINKGVSAKTVILNINDSDINDIIYRAKCYNQNFRKPNDILIFFYGSSFIFRHICHNYFKLNYNLLNSKEQEKMDTKAKDVIIQAVINFNNYCIDKNMNFVVVFQPFLYDIKSQKFELQYVIDEISTKNINIINANHFLEDKNNINSFYWPIDMHFNKKGYKEYSHYIYKKLIKFNKKK